MDYRGLFLNKLKPECRFNNANVRVNPATAVIAKLPEFQGACGLSAIHLPLFEGVYKVTFLILV